MPLGFFGWLVRSHRCADAHEHGADVGVLCALLGAQFGDPVKSGGGRCLGLVPAKAQGSVRIPVFVRKARFCWAKR